MLDFLFDQSSKKSCLTIPKLCAAIFIATLSWASRKYALPGIVARANSVTWAWRSAPGLAKPAWWRFWKANSPAQLFCCASIWMPCRSSKQTGADIPHKTRGNACLRARWAYRHRADCGALLARSPQRIGRHSQVRLSTGRRRLGRRKTHGRGWRVA